MEHFLNYLKNVSTDMNNEIELKIDYETLKVKLMGKFKKNIKKVDEYMLQYTALKNDGGVFRLSYKPEVSGELKIVVQNDQHYYTLYQYEVR
jgi:hypothetical protein